LESITVAFDGTEAKHVTAGAFIFIGLDPNTSFLENSLNVDERGFIVTDTNFLTSVDGIFAAGDVRSGSTKQIASAVGEGAAVAIQIRYYLDSLDRVGINS
jgi:thioredoxin reductase (NADPH)